MSNYQQVCASLSHDCKQKLQLFTQSATAQKVSKFFQQPKAVLKPQAETVYAGRRCTGEIFRTRNDSTPQYTGFLRTGETMAFEPVENIERFLPPVPDPSEKTDPRIYNPGSTLNIPAERVGLADGQDGTSGNNPCGGRSGPGSQHAPDIWGCCSVFCGKNQSVSL